jgi:hypothetical protein
MWTEDTKREMSSSPWSIITTPHCKSQREILLHGCPFPTRCASRGMMGGTPAKAHAGGSLGAQPGGSTMSWRVSGGNVCATSDGSAGSLGNRLPRLRPHNQHWQLCCAEHAFGHAAHYQALHTSSTMCSYSYQITAGKLVRAFC